MPFDSASADASSSALRSRAGVARTGADEIRRPSRAEARSGRRCVLEDFSTRRDSASPA